MIDVSHGEIDPAGGRQPRQQTGAGRAARARTRRRSPGRGRPAAGSRPPGGPSSGRSPRVRSRSRDSSGGRRARRSGPRRGRPAPPRRGRSIAHTAVGTAPRTWHRTRRRRGPGWPRPRRGRGARATAWNLERGRAARRPAATGRRRGSGRRGRRRRGASARTDGRPRRPGAAAWRRRRARSPPRRSTTRRIRIRAPEAVGPRSRGGYARRAPATRASESVEPIRTQAKGRRGHLPSAPGLRRRADALGPDQDRRNSRSSRVRFWIRLLSALRMASARSRLLLLELEDLLLDRVAADQAVGEDVLRLADAVRAVDGLGLDGGVPPGVEQEDVLGGRQVQAEAAGLQADQEERAVGVVLEPLDPLGAVAGPAVEVFVGEPLGVEPVADDRQEAGELREDQDLVPLLDDLGQLRQEHVELGAGLADAARVDQAGVAGRLAQPQQRLEDLDLRAVQLGGVLARAAPGGSGRAARRRACAAPAPARSRGSARSSRAGPWRPAPWSGGG